MNELGIFQNPTILFQDNTGSATWATADIAKQFNKRNHIDISNNFVKYHILKDELRIKRIEGSSMKADFLTKILGPQELRAARSKVGIINGHDVKKGC